MKEINIAEVLKNKPRGIKLYSPIFGECTFSFIQGVTDAICVITDDNREFFDYKGLYSPTGEFLLFPSKYMHDWSKFTWKKGDVLVNGCGFQCIFKEWASDDYTKFNGCYSNSRNDYENVSNAETAKFNKLDHNLAYGYIREIERKLGGVFNLETLEIEKAQPEFKDGDILCVIESSNNYHYILIYEGQDDEHIYRYVTMLENNSLIIEKGSYFTKPKDYSMRYATEEEKQQLFGALAKEDKVWDAEKKQIVDLKPKVELKPFDKVLVRDFNKETWKISFFGFKAENDYVCINGKHWYQCLLYEGNEHLLGTTKDPK